MEKRLYDVVDYILNEADSSELEVIYKALTRRMDRSNGMLGLDATLNAMISNSVGGLQSEVEASKAMISRSVRDMVTKIIRQQAPELDEDQVEELWKAWGPGSKTGKGRRSDLPPDALYAMVLQFLNYSSGHMSFREQMELNRSIPDWKSRYWESFGPGIRGWITEFVNGRIERSVCEEQVRLELQTDA